MMRVEEEQEEDGVVREAEGIADAGEGPLGEEDVAEADKYAGAFSCHICVRSC